MRPAISDGVRARARLGRFICEKGTGLFPARVPSSACGQPAWRPPAGLTSGAQLRNEIFVCV